MTFRKELTTLQIILYNDINEDSLLYILLRKQAILDLKDTCKIHVHITGFH